MQLRVTKNVCLLLMLSLETVLIIRSPFRAEHNADAVLVTGTTLRSRRCLLSALRDLKHKHVQMELR
jgi:hypothetical protein